MYKLFSKEFSKQVYRYAILWPKALFRKIDIKRYHKQLAVLSAAYVVMITLVAIEHQSGGGWGMPVILFNVAVLLFILGLSELMLVIDKRYSGIQAKCQALSRAISYCGVALTTVLMCDLYANVIIF